MCGIAGSFSLDPTYAIPTRVRGEALRELAPRGPDGEGSYEAPGVWLGHRRLAILDPEHGRQPWVEPHSGQVLVYNGELYNFLELRQRFLRAESLQGSTGDTAVLSALLGRMGTDALAHTRGMFAFAWFDPHRKQILLARDRLGVKPLYYCWRNDVLSFASSIPALLQLVDGPRRIDGVALTHYLATARTSFGNRTLFDGIYSLEPGHCLSLRREPHEEPQQWCYWSPPVVAESEKDPGPWESALATCRGRVEESVREQMVSDVPLGLFLSGGLDSAIIAGALPESPRSQPFAFNVGYKQSEYNEWEHAWEVATARGIDCRHVSLGNGDRWADLGDLIRHKGMPVSTPNEIAIRKLAQAFSTRGKVALTGEGADEIFAGYPLPCLGALDYDRSQDAAQRGAMGPALNAFYGRSEFRSRADHYLALNSWTRPAKRDQWLKQDWRASWEAEALIADQYAAWFVPLAHCSTLEAYLHLHLRINLEGLLSRVDSSTMAASVEARVPFTDHRLVEWAFQIPDAWKIALCGDTPPPGEIARDWLANGRIQGKRILREAFRDTVPASIYHRPKMSFPSPFVESLNGLWKPQVESLLRESTFLKDRLSVPPQLLFGEGIALWLWVNIALWAEIWEVE